MTALAMKQQGLKPAAKIALYWLTEHHNSKTGDCFPSLKTLMAECEMGRTTLVRQLDALEKAGLIERIRRTRANGSQTSTAYKFNLIPVPKRNGDCFESELETVPNRDLLNLGNTNLGNEPEEHDHRDAAIATAPSLDGPANRASILQQGEIIAVDDAVPAKASKRNIAGDLYDGCTTLDEEFERVWIQYPRKVGKGAACKAWTKARSGTEFKQIAAPLAIWINLQRGTDPKFTPHFSTWLNEGRWNDDQTHAINRRETTSDRLDRLGNYSLQVNRDAVAGPQRQLHDIELEI
jgi:hypothetical protein